MEFDLTTGKEVSKTAVHRGKRLLGHIWEIDGKAYYQELGGDVMNAHDLTSALLLLSQGVK